MAKIPVKVLEQLTRIQNEQIPELVKLIKRFEEGDTNIPEWLAEKPVAFYEGKLESAYMFIETMQMAYKAYNGFQYEPEKGHRVYLIR